MPAVSVVIPTFNRKSILLKCLDALKLQTISPCDFEVIVCDDGSTDGTYEELLHYQAKYLLRCLRQKNSAPAAARNRAIREATADLILILNDDAILDPKAIGIHLEEHYKNKNEKIAVLGKFTLHKEYNDLSGPIAFALDNSDLIFNYKLMSHRKIYDHEYFYTCNISIRKDYLFQVGLFDVEFKTAGAEDIEIGYRLYRQGVSIVYRPDCIAHHAHSIDIDGLARMFKARGNGGVLLFLRHPELYYHYRGITIKDVRKIHERHEVIEPHIRDIAKLLKCFDKLFFSPPEKDLLLSEMRYRINFRNLWREDQERVINKIKVLTYGLEKKISDINKSNNKTSLDVAAEYAYPCLCFMKWYYDSVGIVESKYIEKLIESESNKKKSNNLINYLKKIIFSSKE